jgi:hypothetical protein
MTKIIITNTVTRPNNTVNYVPDDYDNTLWIGRCEDLLAQGKILQMTSNDTDTTQTSVTIWADPQSWWDYVVWKNSLPGVAEAEASLVDHRSVNNITQNVYYTYES